MGGREEGRKGGKKCYLREEREVIRGYQVHSGAIS